MRQEHREEIEEIIRLLEQVKHSTIICSTYIKYIQPLIKRQRQVYKELLYMEGKIGCQRK